MCWVLYIAADEPLPLRAFDSEAPAFNVADLTEHELGVRVQFSKPHVYALGSHTRCGCGFDRGQAHPDRLEELAATRASLGALRDYLNEAMRVAGPVELYACWFGDQAAAPDHHLRLGPESFGPEMTWFPDRTFIELSARTESSGGAGL